MAHDPLSRIVIGFAMSSSACPVTWPPRFRCRGGLSELEASSSLDCRITKLWNHFPLLADWFSFTLWTRNPLLRTTFYYPNSVSSFSPYWNLPPKLALSLCGHWNFPWQIAPLLAPLLPQIERLPPSGRRPSSYSLPPSSFYISPHPLRLHLPSFPSHAAELSPLEFDRATTCAGR